MIHGVPWRCSRAAMSAHWSAAKVWSLTLDLTSEVRSGLPWMFGTVLPLTCYVNGCARCNEQAVRAGWHRVEDFLKEEILHDAFRPVDPNLAEDLCGGLHHHRRAVQDLRQHQPQKLWRLDRNGSGQTDETDLAGDASLSRKLFGTVPTEFSFTLSAAGPLTSRSGAQYGLLPFPFALPFPAPLATG